MVVVEHTLGVVEIDRVVAAVVPRQFEDAIEPGTDPGVLRRLGARALEAVELLADGVAHAVGASSSSRRARYSPTTSSSPSPSSLRIAASCWRRRNSRSLLVDALADVVTDRLGDLQLGEVTTGPRHDQARVAPPSSTARKTASRSASSNSAHSATQSASAPGSRLRRSNSGRRRERRNSAISSRLARSSAPMFLDRGRGARIV